MLFLASLPHSAQQQNLLLGVNVNGENGSTRGSGDNIDVVAGPSYRSSAPTRPESRFENSMFAVQRIGRLSGYLYIDLVTDAPSYLQYSIV